jgi:hypothetical protein
MIWCAKEPCKSAAQEPVMAGKRALYQAQVDALFAMHYYNAPSRPGKSPMSRGRKRALVDRKRAIDHAKRDLLTQDETSERKRPTKPVKETYQRKRGDLVTQRKETYQRKRKRPLNAKERDLLTQEEAGARQAGAERLLHTRGAAVGATGAAKEPRLAHERSL